MKALLRRSETRCALTRRPRRNAIEALEPRWLMINTVQVDIPASITTISATDLQNAGINCRLKDIQGMITVTGENVAAQTAGKTITITGQTTSIDSLSIIDGSPNSSIFLRALGNPIPLHEIESVEVIKSIDLRGADFTGTAQLAAPRILIFGNASASTINITQSVPSLKFTGGNFGGVQLNITPSVGGVNQNIIMNLDAVTDSNFDVEEYVKSIRIRSALQSSPGAGSFTGNSAGSIRVGGDFNYDLKFTPTLGLKYTLSDYKIGGTGSGTWDIPGATKSLSANAFDNSFNGSFGSLQSFGVKTNFSGRLTAGSIGRASIGNDMFGGVFDLTNPFAANSWNLGSLRVGNTISSSHIMSNGNLGSIKTMFTFGSEITAGLKTNYVFGTPIFPADFDSQSTIRSFISDCPKKTNSHFSSSYVGAYFLPNIHVGNVQTQTGGAASGFGGTAIDKITFAVDNKAFNLKNLNTLADVDAGLQRAGLMQQDLGDFKILLPAQ